MAFHSLAAMENPLVLDPAIRDWVLIPMIYVLIIVSVLRNNITRLMKNPKPADLKALAPRFDLLIHSRQILVRGRRFYANSSKIPRSSFLMRKAAYTNSETGLFLFNHVESSHFV